MRTEDMLLTIYLAGCALFYAAALFECYVLKKWQRDDAATLGLLVCWMWPLLIFAPFMWLWDVLTVGPEAPLRWLNPRYYW